MSPNSTPCDFCNELSGSAENAFARIYKAQPKTRVLLRTNEFAIVPSIGQIVEGYLLVLPLAHFKALGDLPVHLHDKLAALCQTISTVMNEQYSPSILYEHGTRAEGVGGCGIYHAHLHVVPLAGISDPVDLLKKKFRWKKLSNLREITEQAASLSSYLFYQDHIGTPYLFDTGPLPSQYMRKVLASALGNNEWNWRNAGREKRLIATIQRLSECFEPSAKFAATPWF